MTSRRDILKSTLGAASMLTMGSSFAQAETTKMVIPVASGGLADILFRIIQDPLERLAGRPLVADYKPGGGGAIGLLQTARAPADGTTLGWAYSGPMSTIPILRPSVGYDPRTDLTPVSLIMRTPSVFFGSMNLPVSDIAGLIAYAKSGGKEITCGNAAVGGLGHLTSVLLGLRADIKLLHVPYTGTPALLTALMSGDLNIGTTAINTSIMKLVEDKRIKILGVASNGPSELVPGAMPVSQVLPGFKSEILYGAVAPKGTPRPIVERWNSAFVKVLSDKAIQAKYIQNSVIPMSSTPEQYSELIKAEYDQWADVIKRAGIDASAVR
ncbi:Bug family tripartite tricarboxylate transporter substrate binding protein [Ramlibacter henchirensis]|nr:tripartite tricarboxylate transporter substrate binding protein [Ramlibacter henchirensis]